MTQAEYARQRDRSKPLICRAVKQGQIVLVDGKVDEFQADDALGFSKGGGVNKGRKVNKVDPEVNSGGENDDDNENSSSGKSYWKQKARREAAEASLKEMDLAQRRQELVEVEVVSIEFSKLVDAVRQKLLAIPSKIAPITHKQKTIAAVQQVIEQGIHEALNEFGSYDAKSGQPRSPRVTKKNRGTGKKAKTSTKAKSKRVGK